MGELAAAEQVRPATISRLVQELEREGLVARKSDPQDRRVQRVQATARGRRLLQEGRRRRVARLAADLARLPDADRRLLERAAALLARLSAPGGPGGPAA
jgi:DNA-binding MarR family transcriptional regulator